MYYQPAWFTVEAITIITPRSVPGSQVFETGTTQKYSVLTDVGYIFTGNWVGTYTAGSTFNSDQVFDGRIPMVNAHRNKITYYPSKRDTAIIGDTEDILKNAKSPDIDPQILVLGLENNSPRMQGRDLLVDIRVTRWGWFTKAS